MSFTAAELRVLALSDKIDSPDAKRPLRKPYHAAPRYHGKRYSLGRFKTREEMNAILEAFSKDPAGTYAKCRGCEGLINTIEYARENNIHRETARQWLIRDGATPVRRGWWRMSAAKCNA